MQEKSTITYPRNKTTTFPLYYNILLYRSSGGVRGDAYTKDLLQVSSSSSRTCVLLYPWPIRIPNAFLCVRVFWKYHFRFRSDPRCATLGPPTLSLRRVPNPAWGFLCARPFRSEKHGYVTTSRSFLTCIVFVIRENAYQPCCRLRSLITWFLNYVYLFWGVKHKLLNVFNNTSVYNLWILNNLNLIVCSAQRNRWKQKFNFFRVVICDPFDQLLLFFFRPVLIFGNVAVSFAKRVHFPSSLQLFETSSLEDFVLRSAIFTVTGNCSTETSSSRGMMMWNCSIFRPSYFLRLWIIAPYFVVNK